MTDDTTLVSDLLKLVASGLDIDAAAKRLGVSSREAARQLAHDTAELRAQRIDVESERQIELVHVDMLRRALMPLALSGDIGASRLLVRLAQYRAELLGLLDDGVGQVLDVDPDEGVTDLDRLRARRRARREATS